MPLLEAECLDLKALQQRGWTKRLVERFLGEPDQLYRVLGAQSGRPQNLYSAKRVARVELSDREFAAEKRRTELYASRLKGVQGAKKKNLAAMVEAMTMPDLGVADGRTSAAGKKNVGSRRKSGTCDKRTGRARKFVG